MLRPSCPLLLRCFGQCYLEGEGLRTTAEARSFCNGVVAPRPARDTASVIDGNGVQGKPKTPFERMKVFVVLRNMTEMIHFILWSSIYR